MSQDLRSIAQQIYHAAVQAVHPAHAMARVLEDPPDQVWILALGKAATAMTDQVMNFLERRGLAPVGGLVVTVPGLALSKPHPRVRLLVGDHPEPGPRSLEAARAIEALVTSVRPGDHVWVLLSGGATSLVAAPAPAPAAGVSFEELCWLYRVLLRSGLDIASANQVRKRFSRWGGGRLAVALDQAGAWTRVFAISDVIGDHLAAIGSGPCVGDPSTAASVREVLRNAGLWTQLPSSLRTAVEAAVADPSLETPKPHDQAFDRVRSRIIATNDHAKQAAAAHAEAMGWHSETISDPLVGEASVAGRRFVDLLRARPVAPAAKRCVIAGGETTVALGAGGGRGGRCQEFALAAAERLAAFEESGWVILAAGTDGRDGPTDAAGAVVDPTTWQAIERAGRDPRADLAIHDSYAALAAAGALFKPGPTGTNVMDVVVGLEVGRRT